MEVLTTVGILFKLSNSFPTRVLKQVYVGIAYVHFQLAFTSWRKAPARSKSIENGKSRVDLSIPSWNSSFGVEI